MSDAHHVEVRDHIGAYRRRAATVPVQLMHNVLRVDPQGNDEMAAAAIRTIIAQPDGETSRAFRGHRRHARPAGPGSRGDAPATPTKPLAFTGLPLAH
jgi:hypothetical protein